MKCEFELVPGTNKTLVDGSSLSVEGHLFADSVEKNGDFLNILAV